MQKRCIRILDVRQEALYVAHKMQWRCRCRCILMLSAYPVEPTGCGAAHSKYCGKREHQCGDDVVYLKTETKPFTHNAYYHIF